MAADTARLMLGYGKPFVRQVVIEANEAGLDPGLLGYVFWAIVEGRKHWPAMKPKLKASLDLGRDLMVAGGDVPSYRGSMLLPATGEDEQRVDAVLKTMAFWVGSQMNASLIGGYMGILDKWEGAMQKATEGRLPKNRALPYMKALFEAQLDDNCSRFSLGSLLCRWIFSVM